MDVRFHCIKRVRQSGKKAKHDVFGACKAVCSVLRLKPWYGRAIPRFHHLRTMRIRIPGYNVGKGGGYRLIYSAREMDQCICIVFLEAYSKSEHEDLDADTYARLSDEAREVLSKPLQRAWD